MNVHTDTFLPFVLSALVFHDLLFYSSGHCFTLGLLYAACVASENMAANTYRRGHWLSREVEHMLACISEGNHQREVMLCVPRYDLYLSIARRMPSGGFLRSPLQVKNKLKILIQNFYRTLLQYGENPLPDIMPPFFPLLKRLWVAAGRPESTSSLPIGKSTFLIAFP